VSSEVQQKERTIDSQVLELKRQIAAAGDVLVREYVDDGYSGATLDRPALEQMRQDVKTDSFDTIYFLNTDRIARDVAYQAIIIGEPLKHDKQTSSTEKITSTTLRTSSPRPSSERSPSWNGPR
jgi:site-specific DNA recombinase